MSEPRTDTTKAAADLLGQAMTEGYRLLADLDAAEAEVERLERDLHAAMARARVIRGRYDANRNMARSMWDTVRGGIVATWGRESEEVSKDSV